MKRDYSFLKDNHKNRKCIRAIDEDGNETFYKSLYKCDQVLGINCGLIKNACECKNNVKGGYSKINGKYYKFKYVYDKEIINMVKNQPNKKRKKYIKKSDGEYLLFKNGSFIKKFTTMQSIKNYLGCPNMYTVHNIIKKTSTAKPRRGPLKDFTILVFKKKRV